MSSTDHPTQAEKDPKLAEAPTMDISANPEAPPTPADPSLPSGKTEESKETPATTLEGKERPKSQESSHQEGDKSSETKESDMIPTAESGHVPITDLIINDHDEARNLYEDYKKTTDMKQKKKIRNQLVKVLVLHDECEQVTAYPLLRDKVPGEAANHEYQRSLDEHQELRSLLYEIRYADMENDSDFDSKLQAAMDSAFKHIDTEEQNVLPMIKEHVDQKQLVEAGDSYMKHKKLATTRPHPNAPKEGFAAQAANIMMGPFDKLRDALYHSDDDEA